MVVVCRAGERYQRFRLKSHRPGAVWKSQGFSFHGEISPSRTRATSVVYGQSGRSMCFSCRNYSRCEPYQGFRLDSQGLGAVWKASPTRVTGGRQSAPLRSHSSTKRPHVRQLRFFKPRPKKPGPFFKSGLENRSRSLAEKRPDPAKTRKLKSDRICPSSLRFGINSGDEGTAFGSPEIRTISNGSKQSGLSCFILAGGHHGRDWAKFRPSSDEVSSDRSFTKSADQFRFW